MLDDISDMFDDSFPICVSVFLKTLNMAWSLILTPVNFEKPRWHVNTFFWNGPGSCQLDLWQGLDRETGQMAAGLCSRSCQGDANSTVCKL